MNIWVIGILIFLLIDVIVVLLIVWKRSLKKRFGSKEVEYITSHWIRVIDTFPGNPKQAIMDADKILDFALGKKGYEGSLGEKLKKGGSLFSDLNGVWSAHKLRNRVAHELGEIDREEGKRALKQFKKALNDLGAKL